MNSDARSHQLEIYSDMSPARKLRAALDLYWSARSLKETALRTQHPEWSEEQVRQAVREVFLNASS